MTTDQTTEDILKLINDGGANPSEALNELAKDCPSLFLEETFFAVQSLPKDEQLKAWLLVMETEAGQKAIEASPFIYHNCALEIAALPEDQNTVMVTAKEMFVIDESVPEGGRIIMDITFDLPPLPEAEDRGLDYFAVGPAVIEGEVVLPGGMQKLSDVLKEWFQDPEVQAQALPAISILLEDFRTSVEQTPPHYRTLFNTTARLRAINEAIKMVQVSAVKAGIDLPPPA